MDAKAGCNVVNVKIFARKAAEEIVREMPLYRSLQTVTPGPQRDEDKLRADQLLERIYHIIVRNFLNLEAES